MSQLKFTVSGIHFHVSCQFIPPVPSLTNYLLCVNASFLYPVFWLPGSSLIKQNFVSHITYVKIIRITRNVIATLGLEEKLILEEKVSLEDGPSGLVKSDLTNHHISSATTYHSTTCPLQPPTTCPLHPPPPLTYIVAQKPLVRS